MDCLTGPKIKFYRKFDYKIQKVLRSQNETAIWHPTVGSRRQNEQKIETERKTKKNRLSKKCTRPPIPIVIHSTCCKQAKNSPFVLLQVVFQKSFHYEDTISQYKMTFKSDRTCKKPRIRNFDTKDYFHTIPFKCFSTMHPLFLEQKFILFRRRKRYLSGPYEPDPPNAAT